MTRDEILREAMRLINNDRAKDYGDAYINHDRIAKLWSVIIDKEITVKDVMMCMLCVKLARLIHADKADSWVDICGYAGLGGELSGKTNDDMP
jgi:hypothetical protein|tara:strand:+ start:1100 stop:1378 length:279 start_codon:yes stop_codon:yes gene_type:complete